MADPEDALKWRPKYMNKGSEGVQNKAPAPLQVTAEQILREGMDRAPQLPRADSQRLDDVSEVSEYQFEKRKNFERRLQLNKREIHTWFSYAKWEEQQGDFRRARSVFERLIELEPAREAAWVKYASMEMRHGFVASARNVWNRAVSMLPRQDVMWQKWAQYEELVGNVIGAREVYQRWMRWTPGPQAWRTYINFEKRYEEWDLVRAAFEDFVVCHPEQTSWLSYAQFEKHRGDPALARAVFERALNTLGDTGVDEKFFIQFAEFEIAERQSERARVIFQFALSKIPKESAPRLYKRFMAFEKQQGDRDTIENAVVEKRRFQYEQALENGTEFNYDVWFDYLRMEEEHGDLEVTRAVYERAIAVVPPDATEKRFWERYVYLWIYYGIFEELLAQDPGRARQVWARGLAAIPHSPVFAFPHLWRHAADLELRQHNLPGFRKIMGNAIGRVGAPELFDRYIEVEFDLLNFDVCRTLYGQLLKRDPTSTDAWIKYARFEQSLQEIERARGLFELGVSQARLDRPEILWKAFIDFETEEGDHDRAFALFERLLTRTHQHVKVWIAYADLAASVERIDLARDVHTRASVYLKEEAVSLAGQENSEADRVLKEARILNLKKWIEMERTHGSPEHLEAVKKKLPQKVMRRRRVLDADGQELGWSEYYDYIFPDEAESKKNNLKFVEMARKWAEKRKRAEAAAQGAIQADTGLEDVEGGGEQGQGDPDPQQDHEQQVAAGVGGDEGGDSQADL